MENIYKNRNYDISGLSFSHKGIIPKMTRSEHMEEQILIVDLYFSEKALYIVIFLVSFKPLNIQHIKSNLFFLPVVIQSPVADGNLGSGLSWLMKQQYFIL